MTLQDVPLLVGVTGGIAAYKAAALVSRLVAEGARVSVVMTKAATKLVAPQTFYALSGNPVYTSLWNNPESPYPHVSLSRETRLFCVAPASADIIAKAAHGIADDAVSSSILAFDGPVLMAPAMNSVMWAKPATQRNIAQLKADGGFHFVGPDEGRLACGQEGPGRMAEPDEILRAILDILG